MGIDWRMGAEWFETCLLDYDPCSNYGNWTYGAGNPIAFRQSSILLNVNDNKRGFTYYLFIGVGNDPREDRYFSIPKQVRFY